MGRVVLAPSRQQKLFHTRRPSLALLDSAAWRMSRLTSSFYCLRFFDSHTRLIAAATELSYRLLRCTQSCVC